MEKAVTTVCKLSHKQFRALLKKFRRKRIRQKLAKEREQLELLEQQKREKSPTYKERQEDIRRNTELYEQFEEKERIRKNKLWLLREEQAQQEFRRKQQQLELEKIKREEERKRILEEFEKQEYVEKQAEADVKKKKSQKEEALQEALSNLEGDGPWHNPIAPANYNVGQEREQCMFFSKTGCCRFGERCSRGHTRPTTSTTILIKGMYSHFSIDQTARDDYDTDIALEYEDKECYQHFKNFYNDVLPEFKKFGKVIQFKVCNNFEPHLRGNVYVQYTREEEAIEAYKNFNGRYYAGKQITCEFTHVIRWRSAICGLHGRKLCPKGINCNFLHVFKNPNDEFWEADRDLPPRENRHNSNSSRKRDYSREDRSDYHSSEYRHQSSRHDSRSERYDSRSERHDSRSERHSSRSDRHDSRSERHDSRSERHSSRSDRHDSRSERRDYRSERHDCRNYSDDSEDYYSNSSSNSSHENRQSSKSVISKDENGHNHKHKKRARDSSSGSQSDSSEDAHKRRRSHKKKKHKKKKSKKHRREEYNNDSTD